MEYSGSMSIEMREPTYFVLLALAGGRRHGYALLEEVAQLSEGRVRLRVATLYAALERLTAEGLLATDGDEVVDSRRRRYFRLTEAGAARLTGEAARLRANAERAEQRLQVGGWLGAGAS